jgi:hypothetical protein
MSLGKKIVKGAALFSCVAAVSGISIFGAVNTNAQYGGSGYAYDDSQATITINPGIFTVEAPDCDMGDYNISDTDVFAQCTISTAVFQDLRGTGVGWTITGVMTNFEGQSDNSQFLNLCDEGGSCDPTLDPSFNSSRFSLTPANLSVFAGDPGTLDGLNDNTSTQHTSYLDAHDDAWATSNDYTITEFGYGYGEGKYEKDLTLDLIVPPYTRAQTYQATLTLSQS